MPIASVHNSLKPINCDRYVKINHGVAKNVYSLNQACVGHTHAHTCLVSWYCFGSHVDMCICVCLPACVCP